ncbi:MAG: type I-G CRISPR-associated protein Csb2, partial [Egibacteraceae bacterium]
MATTLAIRYLGGQVHATPWDRHPNEAAVEWPPSPWRVLRALYAVWRERVPHLPAQDVTGLLTRMAQGTPTYQLPPAAHAHTRHWYPRSGHRGDPKGYAKTLALDAFMAVDPGAPAYMTFPADLTEKQLQTLRALTGHLTYLGRSESHVAVEADPGDAPALKGYGACQPVAEDAGIVRAAVRLLLPTSPLDIDALTATTRNVQRKRLSIPPGAHQVAYSSPSIPRTDPMRMPRQRREVNAVVWNITAPARPSVRSALLQGDALHQELLHSYKQATHGGHSPMLSGCDADGRPLRDDHGHAHVLHYDLDGDQRLDTAILWASSGLSATDVQAAAIVQRLVPRPWLRDFRPVRLGLEHLGGSEGLPVGVAGPSSVWTSLTPFAPPHHPKRGQREGARWVAFVDAQVRKACAWWRVPEPAAVELVPHHPWLTYRRHRASERLDAARRAVGVTLTFLEPVRGPLA